MTAVFLVWLKNNRKHNDRIRKQFLFNKPSGVI